MILFYVLSWPTLYFVDFKKVLKLWCKNKIKQVKEKHGHIKFYKIQNK